MDYFAADRAAEDERLLAQSRVIDPVTKRLLESASPQPSLWSQARAWVLEAAEKGGIATRLGPELYALYRAAGLPGPRLLVEAVAEGGPDAGAWTWANVVSAIVPLMEKFGVATRTEVDPATLAGRLLAEITDVDGCVICPPFTGAWAVRPNPGGRDTAAK